MKSAQIRQAFLDFFASKGHTIVPSSSLVPGNDPTLLFTNAGMVQFKETFLGEEQRDYTRAASSQRCVRAGGKHNDLENVGYTARHHTFFEMLGNFSFGDYFKRDAIHFAWEFLTSAQWLNLPSEKLWVTVYADDQEAYDIWHGEIGIPADRLVRIGDNKGARYASDNFWMMGDTGPCGPCTEIFYDHGPDIWGGPPGSPEEDGDRYIEIWNNVFMQFNRDSSGVMHPLPKPSVDTGMGLERIAAVLQHVHSNYEIDLFQALIKAAAQATGADDLDHASLKVLADHIRATAFLIMDGVLPSNEGRGYVLRRIMRRALRHGHKLGAEGIFFHTLVAPLVAEMGEAYPELAQKQARIEKVIRAEEEQFAKTLANGMAVLDDGLARLDGKTIPGDMVFQLYDTYGFPTDLTNDIARERGYELDMAGYEACMAEQKARARAASQFGVDYTAGVQVSGETEFTGYGSTAGEGRIADLFVDGKPVDRAEAGQPAVVVLDRTPFYAESGGQVGDTGFLTAAGGRFEVGDCRKQGAAHLHIGQVLEGTINRGDAVDARVDDSVRQATALNHSATHLLHAALRQVLGDHVTQQGSLVNSQRLRFDFSHPEAVRPEQLREIEALVNDQIRRNSPVQTELLSMDEARSRGAMALFGEKYGDEVRVLTMGEGFSVELCGGTHVQRTGDIGLLRIVSEAGIASGVRRIEAVTGANALAQFDTVEDTLDRLAMALKTSPAQVEEKARQLLEQNRQMNREIEALKMKLASSAGSDILSGARDIGGVKVLSTQVEGADAKTLRDLVDQVKSRLEQGVVLLAAVDGDKVSLTAGVTKNLCQRIKAGDLMKYAAGELGGKGGGRPDMAQGGGAHPEKLPQVLDGVYSWVSGQLGE
ncbi:MAG: alanine--tRNA ligase [Porticoccaceae bacterium]|nr:alanine--tRNA ligase [Porticoccaceae bacterium]